MTGLMRGNIVVLEGTDGSGKGTQFKRVLLRMQREGYPVATFDFPQYGKPSAYFAERYLRGEYGADIAPRKGSLFYALDRYDIAPEIARAASGGVNVIMNRYVGSNMAHQGGKIADAKEREEFFRWLYDLEYGILGIPKPDLNIILHVPAEVAQKLVSQKAAAERAYAGGATHDLHESNLEHLRAAERVYLEMSALFPREFMIVECMDGDRLMTPEEVEERVWQLMQPLLVK
ncbi:MAG: thymidylate kinase [Candidatus Harrisonbacteria bacterium]|nr:thymidylate kinase [Candidatus Harrisonbacteria bacterium]